MMGESIVLPFSVYTAWKGYGWSTIPEDILREEMDALYRAIGDQRPDFMGSGDSFEGVFFNNWLLAAFRMQSVPKWDSVGRDADYCAFAFMGLDFVEQIDFDALLKHPSFVEPTRTPTYYLEYSGPASAPYSIPAAMELHDKREAMSVDFHSVGDMLAKCGAHCGDWLVTRTIFRGKESTFVKTGEWKSEPEEWQSVRSRKKASLQKISMKDIEMILGGQK